MILLLSGTHEGREIIARLSQKGYRVITLASTEYGCKQAMDDGSQEAFTGELGRKELACLLEQKAVKAVVDFTHPSSSRISNLMEELCDQRRILRLRYLRDETNLPDNSLIYPVSSWTEAAHKSASLGKTVFLTTVSNNLEVFLDSVKGQNLRLVSLNNQ